MHACVSVWVCVVFFKQSYSPFPRQQRDNVRLMAEDNVAKYIRNTNTTSAVAIVMSFKTYKGPLKVSQHVCVCA